MDRVYQAAVQRLDELKQEAKKLEEFVATYRQLAVELHIESQNASGTNGMLSHSVSAVDDASAERPSGVEAMDSSPPKRARVSDNPRPSVVVKAAAEVIRERGRPMSRRSIHKALMARGIHVRGADDVKALGTMLWRSGKDDLVQIEGKGYGLKGVDYEAEHVIPRQGSMDLE